MKKEAVNVKENKKGCVEGFAGRKGKVKWCNYVIVSKTKEAIKSYRQS